MIQINFSEFNNDKLLNDIKVIRAKEAEAIAEFVLYLAEIDRRGLYRDAGYSSLFNYCVQGLKYSESAAYRRIQAARCLNNHPEVYEKLKSGVLNLCTVTQLYRVITPDNKETLFKNSENKSKLELERMIAPLLPPGKEKRDTIRAKVVEVKSNFSENGSSGGSCALIVKEERFSISAEVDSEVIGLIDEAKEILGNVPLKDVLKNALKCFVKAKSLKTPKIEKQNKESITKENTEKSKIANNDQMTEAECGKQPSEVKSRYIAKSVKREIFNRDSGQCTFVSTDGKRCCERKGLQFDHKIPFAGGGKNDSENLRLLCFKHNQLMAERHFGKELIQKYRT